ncbi:unnamed protein product [Coffea canephora]|uniref:DH200=94 genomic scaffold, scaffold_670 n=1 Tax=Coffea canephora TaxID=49390 RepID=A0A068VJC0_COFCA|nr:unnamed protein product [Coffea canephora]
MSTLDTRLGCFFCFLFLFFLFLHLYLELFKQLFVSLICTEKVQLECLREDVEMPPFLESVTISSINLWMNSAQSRSSTHYDPHHNLLCIVSGCKQGLIFYGSSSLVFQL